MTRYYNISRYTHREHAGYQLITRIFSFALFCFFAIFTTSCEKGILKIGTDLLPDGDFVSIKAIDTLSIFSYTQYDPKVESDNPTITYLGQIADTVFGKTNAEFVTQLRLGTKWTGGNKVTIESVVLHLHIVSAQGGLTTPHTLRFTEISEMIYPDSVYYSNRKPNLTEFVFDSIVIPPIVVAGDTTITVTLSNEFGQHIFRDPSKLSYDATHFHFNPAFPDFRSYFKGIYVQMDPGKDPLLISLFLSPPVSSSTTHPQSTNFIAINVKDSADVADELDLIFDAAVKNAAFNKYDHDYLAAAPAYRVQHINDNYRDTLAYLQYLNGVYTKIDLPGLEKLKTAGTLGKIAINKARLVVPFRLSDPSKFYAQAAPTQLVLRYKNTQGTKSTVVDYVMGSSYADPSHQFFDGRLDSVNKVYSFNIPEFVQTYLDGSSDILKPELEIYQGSEIKNVIFGVNKNKNPIKFEFTYTKF
jgi:hypothetical protein